MILGSVASRVGNVCESLRRAPDNGASGPAADRTNQGISALILHYDLQVLFLFNKQLKSSKLNM